jgi:hypothetical protein
MHSDATPGELAILLHWYRIGVVMELIEIAGVMVLSVAVSLAGARVILSASLFLMTRGVAPVVAEVQQSTSHPTQTV